MSFNIQALLGVLKILKLKDIKQKVDIAYSGEEALQSLAENIMPESSQLVYSKMNKSDDEDIEQDNEISMKANMMVDPISKS